MKLDTKALRYLTRDDWETLKIVEACSRDHEVVPTTLIAQKAKNRRVTGVHKCISTLAKDNLIGRLKNAKYDGYRLTYGGLDYLSLHAHTYSTKTVPATLYSVGNQIGVGKESDIFVVASPNGLQRVLKIHRLGRISFRSVKTNRDYLRHRPAGSWMQMSALAAQKEFVFMRALWENGFVVPEPIARDRHTIVMGLVDAFPLRQIRAVPDPAGLYAELVEVVMRFASYGLIHGDFNEFNILIKEVEVEPDAAPPTQSSVVAEEQPGSGAGNKDSTGIKLVPVIIDFPQMISIEHPNAAMYFDRDVNCIKRFFSRKFGFTSDDSGPSFEDAKKVVGQKGTRRLDVEAEASGFSKKMAKELEKYMREVGVDGDGLEGESRGDDDDPNDSGSDDELQDDSNEVQADDSIPLRDEDTSQSSRSLKEPISLTKDPAITQGIASVSLNNQV